MAEEKKVYDLEQRIYGLNPDKNSKNIQGHIRIIGEHFGKDRKAIKKEIGKEISYLERELKNYEGKNKKELGEYYKKIKPVFISFVEGFLAAYSPKIPKTTYRLPRISLPSRTCGLIGGSHQRIPRACGFVGGGYDSGIDLESAIAIREATRKKNTPRKK